ncbi:hypothetical protein ACL02U_24850 [Streptomyces sp. MS06]|uniref:hypothetical protein n=1 Tax=Streptomyces sp. MS06 TaxID=3385974 RepID=UPI00399FE2EE
MRTPLPAGADAALAPVRERLLADARADAEALLAAADADAAARRAAAEEQAAGILAEARRQGAADAEAVRGAQLARAARAARARDLAARRACWEELRRQVADGARALQGTPAYPELRRRLAAHARQALGPGARIGEAPGGGVTGRAPGRRIDCSLTALASRTLDLVPAHEVEELWAP